MSFDLQVNGYGGVDFNQDGLTADDLHRACVRLEADGVEGALATVITEDVDRMCLRLSNLVRLREADPLAKRVIPGLHIEGPFINENVGYRGAHPADAIRPADADVMRRLLDAAGGLTRIVTLAPERDRSQAVTRLLRRAGVVVSAGHCDPSLDQFRAAIDAGATMFTHLGNACPGSLHRHDNVVQRTLSLAAEGRLPWVTFIADGAHIPFFALRNYLRIVGLDRAIIISDAIAPAGLGPGRYTLGRWDLQIDDDLVARSPDGSHLVGSAVSLKVAEQNLVKHVGLTLDQARQLTNDNARRSIGSV
jgi:N-acetylglucosamine-6-phosphate deacetylase